jgi:hypothetical protein
MYTENHFFSSLEKLAEEPINGVVFVSTDKRDLPFLVKLIRSLDQKGELWAKVKLKDLLNNEPARILFVIKLITYGQAGNYEIYQTRKEVEKILSDAMALIEGYRPLSEKVEKMKNEKKKARGYRAPSA